MWASSARRASSSASAWFSRASGSLRADVVENLTMQSPASVAQWTSRSGAQGYVFTADSTSTTITFNDDSNLLGGSLATGSDLLLDNVSVTETTVTGVPAVAVADAYATDEDAALVVPALTGVLANDTDADLDPLTAVLVGDVADGVLALAPDGSFTYTPDADFNGADSFTYLANGGGQDSNTVTVALTVNAVDDAPVAVAENYAATVDTLLTVVAPGVLANDTDAELDALSAVLVDDVANGTLALASNGSFTYQPDAAYEGADSFTYKANGGGQDSNVVTVSLTVSQPGSNLLVNGSFEIGTLLTGDGEPGDPGDFADLANWNAAGSSVGFIAQGNFTATEGVRMAFFNPGGNDYSGTISQSFTTVVGQDYLLEFDAGIVGTAGKQQRLGVVFTGSGSLRADVVENLTMQSPASVAQWTSRSGAQGYVFTANSTSTTITFNDDSDLLGGSLATGADLLLDNVSVTETTVTGVPAVAVADAYATDEDAALVVPALTGVLANDTDADLDPLTAVLVGDVADGVLALAPDGSFTYTPDADFNGADSFTYLANGGGQDSNTVTVALTVNAVDDAPVAVAENYATTVDTLLTVVAPGVLANDTDAELDALSAVLVDDVANGTLALASNGSFTYQPDAAYEGADSFTYKANGGGQDSNVVTVSLTVELPNSEPLVNGSFEIGTLLTGDGEPGDPGDFADLANWNAVGSSVGLIAQGNYTSTDGVRIATFSNGNNTFDGSISQTFPTIIGQGYRLEFDMGIAGQANKRQRLGVTFSGAGQLRADVQANLLMLSPASVAQWTSRSGAEGYLFTADSTSTTITFNDDSNLLGGSLASNSDLLLDNVRVTAVVDGNNVPVAVNDGTVETPFLTIAEDGGPSASLAVLANDSELDFDPLTVTLASSADGAVVINGDNTLSFTPTLDFSGATTISYTISDGKGGAASATVFVTVTAVNDAPVAVADAYSTDEDTLLTIAANGVLANDSDLEGTTLTAVLVDPVSSGTLVLNSNGGFDFTPAANFVGDATFSYKANDTLLDSNVVTVTITVDAVNDAPIAVADAYSTDEDTPLTIAANGVLANDTDAEGAALSAVLVSPVSSGTLVLNANGGFDFTPAANFVGGATFSYKANDTLLDSNVVTVTITVDPVNDAPVAVADAYSTDEDTLLTIAANGVLANDVDLEGTTLSAVLVNPVSSGTLVLNSDGGFDFTPAENFVGNATFSYKANDSELDSNVVTVTITVDAVNDAPVAVADAYSTDEDTLLTIAANGVLANDADAEGATLSAVLVDPVSSGTLVFNSNGGFDFTPAANFVGDATFSYKANDTLLDSNVVTVTITVDPVNDAPVAVADAYSTDEDTPLTIAANGVLANDSDLEGTTLTAVLVSPVSSGTLVLNSNGSFDFTPAANFVGDATFSYKANDTELDSNVVTVTITVDPVNDAPVAVADAYSTDEDTPLTIAASGRARQ